MKKLIPVLLSLLMALAMTATALAATVYTEGALHYTIADESITITGYFGKDAAVTVPASIAGIPVNTIAKGAFTGNDNVKTVDLPDTITAVEEGAFASGITVNCVAPGVIETDMMAAFTAEDKAALAEETPVGRLGTPEEVAKLLVFLAGEDAGYITGQAFGVNGGLVI